MLAKLKTAGSVVGSLMRFAGVNTGNEVGVPFFIRGTTSKPKFIPDAKGVASGILDSALSGKGAKPGDNSQGQPLSDALRGLFKKEETAISPIRDCRSESLSQSLSKVFGTCLHDPVFLEKEGNADVVNALIERVIRKTSYFSLAIATARPISDCVKFSNPNSTEGSRYLPSGPFFWSETMKHAAS